MFVALFTAAMLTIPDPAGDARGDGGYILPTRPALTEDALDLRSFSAQPNAATKGMTFAVAYGQIGNPWNAPSGFSAAVTDIFVKTGLGGQQALGGTGLRVRGSGGWQYHLRVTGFGASLESTDGNAVQKLPAPSVRVEGTSLIIDAPIPPGNYAYWVTSSVYTPLSADGLLRPSQGSDPTALQTGRAAAAAPVDVLASPDDRQAFTDNTLAAVGQTRDTSTIVLLALGGVGLLLTIGATIGVWRRLGRR